MGGQILRLFIHVWRLPNLLAPEGLFLGTRDKFIAELALARAFAGIVTLGVIAYVYPGYVRSLDAVDLGDGPVLPAVNSALKIAGNLVSN